MTDLSIHTGLTRRRFLQATGAAGALGAAGLSFDAANGLTLQKVHAQPAAGPAGQTVITKSFCAQCPARCGIDVYTTNGRVHAIYGTLDNPLAGGKLCPKGHYGVYLLYDADRIKGPMKRTNPKKGRDEDPKFVPISWDEALQTVADRLNALREKGESHRYATITGRGWGYTDVGLLKQFGQLYGTPNFNLGHSSICSDASETVKHIMDGHHAYSAYDYSNCNYLLVFGAGFLESFRPFTGNMRNWGIMRSKAPKTKVTVVDVHLNTTGSAADRLLLTKPGTDGALALAMAHVILSEGLWDRQFVGDFVPVEQPKDADAPRLPEHKFEPGKEVDPATFKEIWTVGVAEWWNVELKDRTPEWAEKITTVPARDIAAVAREFALTKPAVALFERGASAHTNGVYNGMAIHALNALTGNMFAKGGLRGYQMKTAWAKLPIKAEDFMDDYAKAPERKKPRVDGAKSKRYPLAKNMIQEIAINSLKGEPYKLDTVMFYMTGPIFSAPDCSKWEEALRQIFVIDTSPYPGETNRFADLILPDNTYLERLQIADTYPYEGYPISMIRTPAVKPIFDTKTFGDAVIEIGKRIKGPTSEYYKKIGNTENIVKWMCEGFKDKPGDNGVTDFETFAQKGVWYRKPYAYLQERGVFYEWDGKGYNKVMTPEEVKAKVMPTPTGKFEIKVTELEHHAEFVHERLGIAPERAPFPQWVAPRHGGDGDLHFISPKLAGQAEGRSANLPHVAAMIQPTQGGKRNVFLEMHPEAAGKRGIKDGDRVRIKNKVGKIEAVVRVTHTTRPDTVALPMIHGHWAQGRWAQGAGRLPTGSTNEVTENLSEPLSGLACFHSGLVSVEKV
ncbi:MAG: molybdopterin oxidoreductase [Rhodocyclales bacterium CG_4_9_14_3_um_filter_68_10]|nr:MAG: molybdopterin oxidoreductase [Rhodocyclales bacterium CG_4_9_14_3_um_filter_68_10]